MTWVRRGRRVGWLLAFACIGWVAYHVVLPELVAWRLRCELADRGFPEAQLRVAELGLDHVRLAGVKLDDGLALGDVELDAGLSLLWRSVEDVTIRGAQISWDTIVARRGEAASAGPTSALPFSRLRFEDCVLAAGTLRIAISGRLERRGAGMAIDLLAKLPAYRYDTITLRDLAIRARDHDGAIRACASGALGTATGEACGVVPASPAALAGLRDLDVTWRASDPTRAWSGSGDARFAWSARGIAIERGHGAVDFAKLTVGQLGITAASFTGDIAGEITDLRLAGTATAERVGIADGAVTLRDVELPFEVRAVFADAGPRLAVTRPVRARARAADVEVAGTRLRVLGPSLVLPASRRRPIVVDKTGTTWSHTLTWRAREAQWRTARFEQPSGAVAITGTRTRQTARWKGFRGWEPLQLGEGQLVFRTAPGRASVDRGTVRSTGGQILIEPFVARAHRAPEVDLALRGLDLRHVLDQVARGRVVGDGKLDGELTLRVAETTSLVRGTVRARGHGRLRIRDVNLSREALKAAASVDVQMRLVAALADFDYSRLSAVLHRPNASPEVQLSLVGRGRRLPQDLDITLNLRGVRDAAKKLTSRARQESP